MLVLYRSNIEIIRTWARSDRCRAVLYNIFIYESATGLLVWDRNFDPTSKQQLEMFSSFFSAIRTFLKEVILKGSTGEELKNIEMGTHLIMLFAIKDLGLDLVFIADRDDEKNIKRVATKIAETLSAQKDLFTKPFDGEVSRFMALSAPIMAILSAQKGLIDQTKSLLEDHELIIRKLFAKRGKLDPSEELALRSELDRLQKEMMNTRNLFIKHRILDQKMQIEQRIADSEKFLASSRLYRNLVGEIEEVHYKLNYWLKETKEALHNALNSINNTQKSAQEADYKHVFRNLMDFAENIKKIADDQVAVRFRVLARYFIDKDRIPPEILLRSISEVINLSDDAFEIARNPLIPLQLEITH